MKLAPPAAAKITYPQLKWMCVCLAFALAAHVAAIPIWVLGVVCAATAIRLNLASRGLQAPSRAIRLGISAAAVVMLFLQLRTFNGLAAGTTLLSLVAGLKMLETQTRRDLYVIALIIYFLSVAALLRSESFWLLSYLIGLSWLTTTALLRLTHASPLPDWRRSMRYAGRISAQAVPIALVFWLFFPRFDAPLWHVPSDEHSAESGLGDTMSPGDITDLALSDDIAFRVRFAGGVPPARERYWRGPVLHDFDGHTWRRDAVGLAASNELKPTGGEYRYTVSLEPNQHHWLFMLDWPDQWDLAEARLTSDYMLVQATPVSKPVDISATSHTHVEAAAPLDPAMRRRDLRLPAERNPRTLEFALGLHREHPDAMDYVRAVLEMFHGQQFYYTLEPPPLSENSVDDFLFDTKRGFCGHYASAFAALTRAAGIPTRVVTGYQGGTFNYFSDYWIVRQSDAHAWDEIWIEGRGWLRIDPTAAVSPARVERGAQDALAADSQNAGWGHRFAWLSDMRLQIDAIRQMWRERILRFNQLSQDQLLSKLGVPEPDGEKIVMAMAVGLALGLAWLTWQVRREQRPETKDPLVRAYDRLCRKLAAAGLPRSAHEGAEAFAARVAAERPDLAGTVIALCTRYSRLRYGAARPSDAERSFIALVRAFRPPRRTAGPRRPPRR